MKINNTKIIIVLLILLTTIGVTIFYNKSKTQKEFVEAKIEKQNECQKNGRQFDETFRERRNEITTFSRTITGDGRFNLVTFKGNEICVYQNNWVDIFASNNSGDAIVHHRIINIDTQEELASVDWTRKFISGEWVDDEWNNEITEKVAAFIVAEKATFGNSVIFPNIDEYRN